MGFLIHSITETYLEQLLQLHIDAFLEREPVTIALGVSARHFAESKRQELLMSIRKAYAIGAFDDNKLIGFIICSHDAYSPERPQMPEEFQKLSDAFKKLDAPLNKKPYVGKKLFHLETIGVDEAYAGHGIGSDLVKKAVEIARKDNFAYAYAECTNIRSVRNMINNGFQIIHHYPWQESGIKEFENIEGNFSLTVKSFEKIITK